MEESPVAAQVWRSLEQVGCERSVSSICGLHRVEIVLNGQVIGAGEHALLSLANSGALLEAMKHVNAGRTGR